MDPQPDGSRARAREPWDGHTAVITGAGSGIGAGMARAAAGMGMTVVLADVDEGRISQVANGIHRAGGRALPVPTDVTSLPAVEHLADVAFGEVGGVRLVANNAGVEHVGLLWEEPAESWHRLIGVNLHGGPEGRAAARPRPLDHGRVSSVGQRIGQLVRVHHVDLRDGLREVRPVVRDEAVSACAHRCRQVDGVRSPEPIRRAERRRQLGGRLVGRAQVEPAEQGAQVVELVRRAVAERLGE
jgi:NAD(P)-dependent dehydrogenase (short-subunit alcohol dehydrogenase family)